MYEGILWALIFAGVADSPPSSLCGALADRLIAGDILNGGIFILRKHSEH
jgi:hypothetical protein